MPRISEIPPAITFVDVETTGLSDSDRVVSIGAISLHRESILGGSLPVSFIHLVFNPERKSHPAAAAVHGYSDNLLRHQDRFSVHAAFLHDYLHSADLIVAHNAKFDASFINREFSISGHSAISRPVFCTMHGCQAAGSPSAGLEKVCARIGLKREDRRHGALEDAWLAMMVYFWLHNISNIRPFSDAGMYVEPFNMRAISEMSEIAESKTTSYRSFPSGSHGGSNTGMSAAANAPEANRISILVEAVKHAKRVGNLVEAERLLLAELDRQEASAQKCGWGVAPWYYEQLAIVYSKQKRFSEELSVLQRYDQQPKAPGIGPALLRQRLEKVSGRLRG